ncbi:MAG TPA: DoxX family protein [Nocardioidaceae bacterium]|nr:DoxX family protein [Nocardioidaceae bacterium]
MARLRFPFVARVASVDSAGGASCGAPPASGGRKVVATVALWLLSASLALPVAMGGVAKLLGDQQMVDMFTDIGTGQWLRILVGGLEIAGAVGLAFPRVAGLAAAGLILLMLGAVVTNLVVLHISPVPPLIFLALAVGVATLRRHSLAFFHRTR